MGTIALLCCVLLLLLLILLECNNSVVWFGIGLPVLSLSKNSDGWVLLLLLDSVDVMVVLLMAIFLVWLFYWIVI